MKKLEIEYVPISEIVPYSKNPRKNDKAVDIVARSIKEFEFGNPIILDKNNEIICGHTRLKAVPKAIELLSKDLEKAQKENDLEKASTIQEKINNLREVPVIWREDLNEEQVKAFRIMDNKSIEFAEWDYNLLKDEFYSLEDTDSFNFTGFTNDEISKIWDKEVKEDEFPIPKVAKYDISPQEIWVLGEHRLMCGDATKKEDVEALMGENKANVMITDPPYGVNYGSKNDFLNKIDEGNRNQKDIINDDKTNLEEWFGLWLKNVEDRISNTFHIFMADTKMHYLINAIEKSKLKYNAQLIWVKNNYVLGRMDYSWKHESIIYGWGEKHKFYGGFQTTILNCDKPLVSKEHPTMKPVALVAELIKHGSLEKEIVLDLFGGSGSTLIACEQLNRKCYMMEIDPFYCSVIIERFEKITGKKGVKL